MYQVKPRTSAKDIRKRLSGQVDEESFMRDFHSPELSAMGDMRKAPPEVHESFYFAQEMMKRLGLDKDKVN